MVLPITHLTNVTYNASTGVVQFTIGGHGFANGDYIKIDDGSLDFTCVLDGNTVAKSYPRAGYDYPSGRWMKISNVTNNTFDINVGPSDYDGTHTFVSADANSVKRQDGYIHQSTLVHLLIHQYTHLLVLLLNAIKFLPQSATHIR